MLRLINQGVWDKLDRMSDAQFRKVVPEAADSYITFSTGNIKTVLSVTDVTPIQKELKDTEQAMGAGVAKHGTPQWQELANKAALIRKRLVDLTGDCYGAPRFAKKREIPPSDELLNAGYATPDEVPKEVMGWLICHNQIIMSDATDAVRWARIVNTLDDDRYPKGSLTIYRAVATNSIPDIRPGDWVTTNIAYAEQHLEKYFDGNGEILTLDADGADVLVSPTGNGEESIYAPMEFSGEYKPQECEAPSPQ